MGLFKTHWETNYRGHQFTVDRNELTRGIRVSCDGHVIAEKVVTLMGLAHLEGTANIQGREVPVSIDTQWGSNCTIQIAGEVLHPELAR